MEVVASLVKAEGAERLVLCLDENMHYDEGSFRGSELCAQLRSEHAYRGVVVIISADDDEEAVSSYAAAGADASLSKSAGVAGAGKSMAEQLVEVVGRAHAARFGKAPCPWGASKRLVSKHAGRVSEPEPLQRERVENTVTELSNTE